MKRNAWLAVALAPVVGEWIYKFAVLPRPFWIHYYDPEAIYFYQALRILAGLAPSNVDNPGTTVQLAGAAIAFFTGRSPLSFERFLFAAHLLGLAMTILGAFVLSRTLLRDAPPALAVAALWTWFMAPQALEYQMVWCAEIFYFGLGALALAAIAMSLDDCAAARDALAGLSIGVLIATKFLFLAWLPALAVAYIVARDRVLRRIAHATLGAIGGFVATTAVAVARYPAMLSWLVRLASHSGTYGGGKRELPRPGEVLAGYAQLVTTSKAWMLWLAIIAVCAIVAYRRAARPRRALLAFGAAASVLTVLMAVRSPQFRYFLPLALCALLLLAVAANELRNVRWLSPALAVVAGLLVAKAIAGDAGNHRRRIESQLALHEEVIAIVGRVAPNGIVVYSWRFPGPSFALRVETTRDVELAEIARRYPREGHYVSWGRRIVLPPGASKWDVLVIDDSLLPQFPKPVGRTIAQVHEFRIVLPP